jgi:sialate O-acetylesterase
MKILNRNLYLIIILIFFFFANQVIFCAVRLPRLISDGMVLQRNANVKIWGWASINENIKVNFNNSDFQTVPDSKGNWSIILPPSKEGGPFTMTITGENVIVLKDILIGDVWVCSGQSNMEYPMNRLTSVYETEISNSENQFIRQYKVPQKYNFNTPQDDLQSGTWAAANPKNILDFSAVAYFFAKDLYEKYHIPIGLINSSMGGLPAESLISENAIKEFPDYFNEAQKFKDSSLIVQIENSDNKRFNDWYKLLRNKDEGYSDLLKPWFSNDLNTSDWPQMEVPGYWADGPMGPINGVVWFRKEIIVPASMAGKPAQLKLGRIVDADSVFINGIFIGTTSYQYPQRKYKIPSDLLKEGKNSIVVRIISNSGYGGFVLDKPYEIVCNGESIDLKGDWKYKLGTKMEPLASQTFIRWKPVGLFNAMIAPLTNYTIKGVVFYQGESNADKPIEYRKLFPVLINDWRVHWKQGDFPFIFTQLPNFMETKEQPSESNWALFREAQLMTLSLPNTGMAVTIDLGAWNDIHPVNKKDVGRRLALVTEKVAYGDNLVVYSGPIYQSMSIDGNKIILTFSNTGSGLIAKGTDDLKYFAIAGPDNHFVWAKAKIENNKVIVWNDDIKNPVAVRYAWADNPQGANLYNIEGLPASPFRTDK